MGHGLLFLSRACCLIGLESETVQDYIDFLRTPFGWDMRGDVISSSKGRDLNAYVRETSLSCVDERKLSSECTRRRASVRELATWIRLKGVEHDQ